MKPTGATTALAVFLAAVASSAGASLPSSVVPADIASAPRISPAVFRPSGSILIRPSASARPITVATPLQARLQNAPKLRPGVSLNRFTSARARTVTPVVTLGTGNSVRP